MTFELQNDVDLVHEIEAELEKQLEKFECKENDVLAEITKVSFSMKICCVHTQFYILDIMSINLFYLFLIV